MTRPFCATAPVIFTGNGFGLLTFTTRSPVLPGSNVLPTVPSAASTVTDWAVPVLAEPLPDPVEVK